MAVGGDEDLPLISTASRLAVFLGDSPGTA
jgi:hypothetical protein